MFFKLFLIIYLFTQNVICARKEYNVAVLLEIPKLEETFRTAFNDVNLKDKDIKLNPIMVNVTPDDPFVSLNNTCNVLRNGVVGIFGPTSSSNVNIVQSLCDFKELPHILTWGTGPLMSGTQINLYPQSNQLSNAYMDIISYLDWKEFTILYTDAESLVKLSGFIKSAKTAGIVMYIVKLDPDGGNNRPILRALRKSSQTHFILDCVDAEKLYDLLLQIQQIGMLTSNYHYFLTNLDIHMPDLERFSHSGADIMGIKLANTQLDSKTALIVDAVQIFSNTLKSFDVIQDSNLSCKNSKSWRFGYNIINKVKMTSYTGLTGNNIQFDLHGQRNVFELIVYNIKDGELTEKVTWNTDTGINSSHDIGNTIEKDTNVRTFVVVTTLVEPYTMLKQASHALSGNDRYEGFAIDLIHEISELERFNYTFIIREDNQNGAYNPVSGEWTGMIGDLLTQKADLAISDLTITNERMDAVDFTDPFMHFGISILSRKPLNAQPDFFLLARPFAIDFWKAIGVTSLIVVFSLYLVGRLCQNEWQKTSFNSKYVVNQLTFSNTVWFVYGSLFRQNTQIKIGSIPGRIIAASWWLLCSIIIAMYISFLISFTVSKNQAVSLQFTDVESLVTYARDGGIRYGTKLGGSTKLFFQASDDFLYQEIYEYMQMHPEDMVHSISDGVHLAESSNYAFFMESTSIEYITQRMCNLAMYGGLLNQNAYGIAARKGSPYLPAISRAILKLQASGKIAALKKKWWEDSHGGNACGDEFIDEVLPLNLINIAGLIHIVAFGLILATLGGILELSIYTYKLSRKFNISLLQAFKHEIKRRFTGGRVKRTVDPVLLSRPILEDEHNTVELS